MKNMVLYKWRDFTISPKYINNLGGIIMEKIFCNTKKVLGVMAFILLVGIMVSPKVEAATTEKLIICGPSTVAGLAKQRNVENGKPWSVDYKKEFGYTLNQDLFFICQGGRGLRYFSGTKINGKAVSQKNSKGVECFDTVNDGKGGTALENLLKNDKNIHYTVAFVCSGNDLTNADMTEKMVENIANLNAEYVAYLANKYKKHTFYVIPITPIDESKATGDLLKHSYTAKGSNNLKRYKFACAVNNAVDNKKISNLKYPNGFFVDLLQNSPYKHAGKTNFGNKGYYGNKKYTKLNGKNSTTAAYRTVDGKHYTEWGCRIVMERILTRCGVVNSVGMKK